MNLCAILRRDGWASAKQLAEAAGRSRAVTDDQMPADIRCYVLDEGDGAVSAGASSSSPSRFCNSYIRALARPSDEASRTDRRTGVAHTSGPR